MPSPTSRSMGERLSKEPRTDIDHTLDDELLASMGGQPNTVEKTEDERYGEEVDVLCHRMRDLKTIAAEAETHKGTAVTYLELLNLPDEARRIKDLEELVRRAKHTLENATDVLSGKYKIFNLLLLDSNEDARRGLVHLSSDEVRTANDEMLGFYKDVQGLLVDIEIGEKQYHERSIAAAHKR